MMRTIRSSMAPATIGLICCCGMAFAQTEAKLTASDAAANARFGYSVSVSGYTAVIGAYQDDGGGGRYSGSAYVFTGDARGTWLRQAMLSASDAASLDRFGGSVSVSRDTAVIGAYGVGDYIGAAYVFNRDAKGAWTEQIKLTASDAAARDSFGTSVSVSGDTVVIGAYGDDDGGENSGAAYVFTRDAGGTWTQQAKLTASDAAAGDFFSISVSVSGDTAVIGADGTNDGRGSAYVFIRDAGTWSQQTKLTNAQAWDNDAFGNSVSVSGDTAVIGAFLGHVAVGDTPGSAFVFTRDAGGAWSEQAKLTASDGESGDLFGSSVSVTRNSVVVGAYGDGNAGNHTGAAYVFMRDAGGVWSEQTKLTASDAAASACFGLSVSMYEGTFLVGADDGAGDESGSAYLYSFVLFSDGFESGDTSAWTPPLFSDGFESGDTSAWSTSVE